MSLHVPLRHLHREGNFSTGLHSRDLTALRLGDHLRIIDEESCALTEATEELQAAIVLNWGEHADRFLNNAWLDGYMGASVGLHVLFAIRVQVGAVDDDLRPSMWIH